MATSLKILSLNCRGLANIKKRQDIFSRIKDKNIDICLLQDVHWNAMTLNIAREEWGYKLIGSPFNTLSRGTAILLNNSFEFVIGDTIVDEAGNFTLLELKLHTGLDLVIGSIYAPNQDNPNFIKLVASKKELFENPNILLGTSI